MYLLFLHFI